MVAQITRDSKGCFKKHNQEFLANIVGEFTINEHHYLIVLVSEEKPTIVGKDCKQEATLPLSRFEIEGQAFAIIEAEPTVTQTSLADLLSERELQIATLVSLGRVNKQIARQLHISEWTVATYIRRIFYKLGVDSRAAMAYLLGEGHRHPQDLGSNGYRKTSDI